MSKSTPIKAKLLFQMCQDYVRAERTPGAAKVKQDSIAKTCNCSVTYVTSAVKATRAWLGGDTDTEVFPGNRATWQNLLDGEVEEFKAKKRQAAQRGIDAQDTAATLEKIEAGVELTPEKSMSILASLALSDELKPSERTACITLHDKLSDKHNPQEGVGPGRPLDSSSRVDRLCRMFECVTTEELDTAVARHRTTVETPE